MAGIARITDQFLAEIVEHLEPVDVLDHFPFLAEDDVRKIEQQEREGNRRDACLQFLTLILRREDQEEIAENVDRLINAFREEGYQRLVECYENSEEDNQAAAAEFLEFLVKMLKPELVDEIDAGSLIPILLDRGLIKVKDQRKLNALQVRDRSEASRELIRTMKKKHKSWAIKLFDALKETQPNLITKSDPGATEDELVQKGLAEAPGNNTPPPVAESDSDEYNSDLEKYGQEDSEKTIKKKRNPEMKPRSYQTELAENAIRGHNTIICAQTGTGKTWVALHITKEHLLKNPEGRVVFLAKTNPLVRQQYNLFQKYLPDKKVYHLHTATKECLGMNLVLDDHHVFFLTPQILLNNINNKRISLNELSLLILDECHHTRKKEPYNNVMKQYLILKRKGEKVPQVVGLTATLGVGDSTTESGALQHMLKLCANLDVFDISTVTENLEELRKYVAVPKKETIKMGDKEKDPLKIMIEENILHIEAVIASTELTNIKQLQPMWTKRPQRKDGKRYQRWTVHFRNKVSCKLRNNRLLVRETHAAMTHLAAYNEALEINYLMNKEHVIQHLQKRFDDDLKSLDRATSREKEFLQMIIEFCKKVDKMKIERNPYLKLLTEKLVELSGEYDEIRGMVFIQTRATAIALAEYLTQELKLIGGILAAPFIGTNKSEASKGMSDTQKDETLENFKTGNVNVLVATSVGSEGIDVPECNFIITYNYTGNEANVIQMSGRARQENATVAHISDSTIQKREEISLNKAKLMDEAFRRLYSMLPEDRRSKILRYQKEIGDFDNSTPDDLVKAKKPFQLICFKCHAAVASNEDIRLYVNQHRVVINPDFRSRCEFDKNTTPSRYTISVIKCAKCKLKWGTTFKIEEVEVPVLKVTAFLFTAAGEEPFRFKKWGKVSFLIDKIDKHDLLEMYREVPEVESPED